MLTFKLIKFENGFYHYEIYPENVKENKGWIIFNPNTGKVKDKKEPNSKFDCFSHFFQDLKDENGNYKESGMVAWY